MTAWPVPDAKARFSKLLDTTLKEGPQVVTRRGVCRACSYQRMVSVAEVVASRCEGTPSRPRTAL